MYKALTVYGETCTDASQMRFGVDKAFVTMVWKGHSVGYSLRVQFAMHLVGLG